MRNNLFSFQLSGRNRYQQRTRYGFWQALGDIGGFYDGLGLIFGSIISNFAATKFLMDLFKSLHVNDQPESKKEKKKRGDLIQAIRNSEPDAFANRSNFGTLLAALKNLRPLKISLQQGAAYFCCRLMRKKKGQRLIQRL